MRRLVSLQLSSGRPPEVRATFDRLVVSGLSPAGARRLIRQIMANEIRAMLSHRRVFDRDDVARRLALLPAQTAFEA